MDDVLVNTSTRLKTRHAVNEANLNAAMKRGMASLPTSKSATPKPIRRNVERFLRLRLRKIQMIRIFPVMIKVAKNPKHNLQNIFQVLKSMAMGSCFPIWWCWRVKTKEDFHYVTWIFILFFFNIYHVKFCFAANVWLRSSVGSTALIFGRNLFLLIPVEAWIYWDFLSAIFFNWSSPENFFLLRFHPQGKILWISFNCYVMQNLFSK